MKNEFLTYAEQKDLVKKSIEGDEKATVALINLCERLIHKISLPYLKRGLDLEDLMQEGIYGVLESIPKYRPEMQCKFITYCYPWIKKRICAYAAQNRIRIPELKLRKLKEYHNLVETYSVSEGRFPTDQECLDALHVKPYYLAILRNLPEACLYFEDYMENTENLQRSPENIEDYVLLHIQMENALSILTDKEQFIIIQHFGLFSTVPSTFADISEELGCSKEWVRQIEKTALKKMKEYMIVN